MGVVPKEAQRVTLRYADAWSFILNHTHPHPPHKGEGY